MKMSAAQVKSLIKSRKKKQLHPQTVISGIKIDRDRPKGTGWCGNENCGHLSHKRFNESAA